ncbi:hypothetical protein MGG_03146 [Pyricularia oryzae 70-15]|uniref:RGS domain-containing protein n=3 Tax=Pyricularia oryzae TaxID=318829 RepID=G4NAT9_PYRO7|nr:uncharacterized protein MGG_03146 [Pyricularia oryzae 70-15]EHA50531.1 hypothetical protein MGG_03146 [Pyricularia oryzae 70-15]ELQ41626.1 hypothetical protein OOU_Y34scaffold00262g8 [Pyricularia oryzae Y34]
MSSSSRPCSMAALAPTLQEILANKAPPPCTLSAFMAYLSQNHCLETLEFTMEAERYRVAYHQLAGDETTWSRDASDHLCGHWQKLINAYITPCGPREVNLPGPVRDRLLRLPCSSTPPSPSELDEAVRIVYELMNDSVLLPFIESMHLSEYDQDTRQGRAKLRISRDPSKSSLEESSRSPKVSLLPQLHIGRKGEHAVRSSSSSSTDAVERDADDNVNSPTAGDPLTPPTTPPTSDWGFGASPGGLQRAISIHNNGWKRMSARLGLGKKSNARKQRGNTSDAPTATSSDTDVMSQPTHSTNKIPSSTKPLLIHSPALELDAVDPSAKGLGIHGNHSHVSMQGFDAQEKGAATWEEPHPGQLLTLPHADEEAWDAGSRVELNRSNMESAVFRCDMTANLSMLQTRLVTGDTCFYRHISRAKRSRCGAVLHSSVSACDSVPTNGDHFGALPSRSKVVDSPTLETSNEDEASVTQSPYDTDDQSTIKEVPLPVSSPQLRMTDFSKYIDMDIDEDEAQDPATIVSSGKMSPIVVAVDDAYGWEAELNRRSTGSSNVRHLSDCHYQQSCVPKRGLLHRFFSIGHT